MFRIQNSGKEENEGDDRYAVLLVLYYRQFFSFRSASILTGTFARGLKNIGNTCFLNSVLQAISSCPPFIRYLADLDPHRDIPFTLGLKNCLRGDFHIHIMLAMLLLLSAKSDEYLLNIVGLRVKGDVSYISSWSETSVKKLVDTSNIFDMIVSFNSNFNGHDQQVSPSEA